MTLLADDQKWPIPAKFRASLDLSDEAAHALLQKCDAEQKELGARINSPLTRNSPTERARSKAYIAIQTLFQVKQTQKLAPEQIEQLAAAFADVGRYDLAAEASKQNKSLYKKYWKAIWADNKGWCKHGSEHQYLKERIFSIREGGEVSLLACNIPNCETWNAAPTPIYIKQQQQTAQRHQGQTRGLTINEAKQWHENHVKRT